MENEIKKHDYSAEEKAKLVESKREHFAAACRACADEWDWDRPCEKCNFLGPDCHRTCGIIMKHWFSANGV